MEDSCTGLLRSMLRTFQQFVLIGLIAAWLTGCEKPERFYQDYTPWIWAGQSTGKVRAGSALPGSALKFDSSLGMDEFIGTIGVDAMVVADSSLFSFSGTKFESEGRDNFVSPTNFADVTFAGGGPEPVRTEYDLLLYRIGYGTAFGVPGEKMFAIEGAIQVIDFDTDLRSATASASLDGTIPVFLVGARFDHRLSESLVLRTQLFGLSYSRVFGIKNDFFKIRGDFLTWRVNVLWGRNENFRALLGASSVILDLDNGTGDRLKNQLYGMIAGLQMRF